MWSLRFDGVNDVVTIAGLTGNAGTSFYTFRVRSGPAGITLPASGVAGIFGTSGSSLSNGLIVNRTGQLRVYTAGTNRYGSTASLISSGVPFDYTLTHNADGTWNIFNNLTNSATEESGTFTTSTTFTALNQIGRSSNSNAVYLQGDIELLETTGLANSNRWYAYLAYGKGSVLPSLDGLNNGALVNFPTNDSQFIETVTGYALNYLAAESASSVINLPSIAGSATGTWSVTIQFEITALPGTFLNIIGNTSTGARTVRINSLGRPEWASVGISGSSSLILNKRYWLRASSGSDGSKSLDISEDGFSFINVGSEIYTASGMSWNVLGGANGEASKNIKIFSVHTQGSSYSDLWAPEDSTGTGTTWTSKTGVRSISLTGFTGTANSWWQTLVTSVAKLLKYHNGSAWVAKPLKYHNGTSWVTKTLKYHNGTSWS